MRVCGTHVPLDGVPGVGDLGVLFVGLDGGNHLGVHALVHLGSEDVPQDPTNQHHDEDDEEDDKEGEEHAADLPIGAQGPQEGDDGHHEASRDQDGSGRDVQIAPQQPLHEGLVGQSPHADREDHQSARLCMDPSIQVRQSMSRDMQRREDERVIPVLKPPP